MPLKSVVDIEIDDADFQRFAAAFGKYEAQLKAAPSAWNDVADATSKAAAAAAGVGVGVNAAFNALHKISTESSSLTRNTERQASAWNSMAVNAGRFTTRVIEATRSLLRWGELSGIIGGILGGGGLFGIDRLAISAGNQRRGSLGLGATPGEVAGFQTDMARVTDPNAFLSNVNKGISDVTSTEYRAMTTAGAHPEGRTDAADAAFDTIEALKKSIDRFKLDATFGPTVHAMGYDALMSQEDLKRLREMPQADVDKYVNQGRQDSKTLELSPGTTSAWQDLQVQFTRAGRTIENTLIVGLVNLAKPLENLSSSFTKLAEDLMSSKQVKEWTDDLASGIRWLDSEIGSQGFHDGVMGFTKGVGDLAHESIEFVSNVAALLPSLDTIKSYETEFGEGLKTAGGAVNAFADAVDTVAKALAATAHGVVDPWTKGTPVTSDEAERWNREHPDNQIPQNQTQTGQGSATAWDRLKSWWNGGQFSGPMMHQESYEVPRGIRNNNPLNLSYVPGQGAAASDGRFGVYNTPEEGIAASERQLLMYQDRDRLSTISQLIGKWAPPGENDTASYIAQVSRDTGIDKDARVDLHDRRVATAIIEAMIRRETGKYANPEVVQRGVDQGLGNTAANPKMQPNGGKPTSVAIRIDNNTGGNATVSASQLAV